VMRCQLAAAAAAEEAEAVSLLSCGRLLATVLLQCMVDERSG
jgi:hypothetical protein